LSEILIKSIQCSLDLTTASNILSSTTQFNSVYTKYCQTYKSSKYTEEIRDKNVCSNDILYDLYQYLVVYAWLIVWKLNWNTSPFKR